MRGYGNLVEGYRRFRANQSSLKRGQWQQLAEGQSPRAVIIACCDSRADPATIFDADPGNIFECGMSPILCRPSNRTGGATAFRQPSSMVLPN